MNNGHQALGVTITGQENRVSLVFIHGFLGSGADWQAVVDILRADFHCVTIDLPGHGKSQQIAVDGFDDTAAYLIDTIHANVNGPFWLVGYSLGARLSMYLATLPASCWCLTARNSRLVDAKACYLQGIIVESGHPGLPCDARHARAQHDDAWASRFEREPLQNVLQDWYQQPVFSSLNQEQKKYCVNIRQANFGPNVAKMLRATSLSKQPCLLDKLHSSGVPFCYVCGEEDKRFSALAQAFGSDSHVVKNAGHDVHQQYPEHVSQLIKKRILTMNKI